MATTTATYDGQPVSTVKGKEKQKELSHAEVYPLD